MTRRLTRRRFLHEAAGLTAAARGLRGLTPPARLGDEKKKPPGERLNIGVVGVAEPGRLRPRQRRQENIYALCDVDENRAADARKAYPQAKFFKDFRQLLDLKEIDAVVCATPDHMHAFVGVNAMRAGKHLYCEKPLAHSVAEVRLMMETAAEQGVVTQMGTQIHAEDNYRRVVEIVQAGVLGPVERVHVWCNRQPDGARGPSRRSPPRPASTGTCGWARRRSRTTTRPSCRSTGAGSGTSAAACWPTWPAITWTCPTGRSTCSTPLTVAAKGQKIKDGDQQTPDLLQVDYTYPARGDQPKVHLTWYNGVPGPDLAAKEAFHGFANGVLFEGPKGQLIADYDHLQAAAGGEVQGLHAAQADHRAVDRPPQGMDRGDQGQRRDAVQLRLQRRPGRDRAAGQRGLPVRQDRRLGRQGGTVDSAEAARVSSAEYRKGWKLT